MSNNPNDRRSENLFEIVAQSNALTEMLLRSGGELTPEGETELDRVSRALVTKVDSCSIILDRLDAEASLWAERAAYYTRISRSMETARTRIRDMLKAAMVSMDTTEVMGEEVRFTLVKGRAKVVIDPMMIDPGYKMEKREIVIDKERVETDLRAGNPVTGAKLEDVVSLRCYAAKRSK
jgi:hypothetical protein